MPLRILIADDNATARNVLHTLLSRNRYQVCGEAENGLEAIAKAAELKPDIVILDLSMPYADGLKAAHHISEILPETPLVLYTLHVIPQLQIEASKQGIRFVVSKAESNTLLDVLAVLSDEHNFDGKKRAVANIQPTDGTMAQEAQCLTSADSPQSLLEPDDLEEAS